MPATLDRASTPVSTPLPEFLRMRPAAALVGVSINSIYRAIRRKDLKAAKVNDRGDLVTTRTWLLEWLERCANRG